MSTTEKRNPAGGPGLSTNAGGVKYHMNNASAEPLLQRLDDVQKSGNGWRARCPNCGGRSRKLSITEADGRVLLHCFDCGDASGVLDAVGLRWADLQPPRYDVPTPRVRERARRALRDAAIVGAVEVLAVEGIIIRMAAKQVNDAEPLNDTDHHRLSLACHRIDNAALVLSGKEHWRPDYAHTEHKLARIKREAVGELSRQLEQAQREQVEADRLLAEHLAARGRK